MFILGNKQLFFDSPFEYNDVQYPSNWLRLSTPEDREALGIVEVPDSPVLDYNFYNVDGTERPLTEIKSNFKQSLNSIASQRLTSTDWYFIRKFDRDIDVPQTIKDQRQEILAKLNRAETEVDKPTTVQEFIEAFKTGILSFDYVQ